MARESLLATTRAPMAAENPGSAAVGLLAEQYDPRAQRLVGNFPQAFSHLALIGTALNLTDVGPARQRQPETSPRATAPLSLGA